MEIDLVFGDEWEEEKWRTLEQTLQGCREQGWVIRLMLHISFENENLSFLGFYSFVFFFGKYRQIGKFHTNSTR